MPNSICLIEILFSILFFETVMRVNVSQLLPPIQSILKHPIMMIRTIQTIRISFVRHLRQPFQYQLLNLDQIQV